MKCRCLEQLGNCVVSGKLAVCCTRAIPWTVRQPLQLLLSSLPDWPRSHGSPRNPMLPPCTCLVCGSPEVARPSYDKYGLGLALYVRPYVRRHRVHGHGGHVAGGQLGGDCSGGNDGRSGGGGAASGGWAADGSGSCCPAAKAVGANRRWCGGAMGLWLLLYASGTQHARCRGQAVPAQALRPSTAVWLTVACRALLLRVRVELGFFFVRRLQGLGIRA